MRRFFFPAVLIALLLTAIGFDSFVSHHLSVHAQALTAPARGVNSTQTLATCAAPATGTTWYCETFTGPYISLNGAAYVAIPLTAPAAGVTSWNGQTGAVTYTPPAPPVTSVNGKTGAVTIAASTTATTTLQ